MTKAREVIAACLVESFDDVPNPNAEAELILSALTEAGFQVVPKKATAAIKHEFKIRSMELQDGLDIDECWEAALAVCEKDE